MNNNISFKSKIRFVDKETFINVVGGKKIDHIDKPIAFAKEFYTNGIRSCTGGGIVSHNKEVCGFHIFDGPINNQNLKGNFEMFINLFENSPLNGLIIGGKKHITRPYSMKNFEIINDVLENNVKNLSIFKQHKNNFAQSNIHYDSKNDTWTILTQFFKNGKETYVDSLKALNDNFAKIKIAENDTLYIGEKRIR